MKEETTMNKQNTGCDMKTITTELCDTEMNALKALRTDYQTKTDVFLKERAVRVLTYILFSYIYH